MYVVWIVVSLLLVVSGRYTKQHSLGWYAIHVILGIAILVLTIAFSSGITSNTESMPKAGEIKPLRAFHIIAGIIMFALCFFLVLNGFLLRFQRKREALLCCLKLNRILHIV